MMYIESRRIMKKGFTLIELLAVIVILAIIALIATPIILGVIDKAKIGSAEQSANGYIDAIENYVVLNELSGESTIDNGVYDLPISGVEVKGQEPTSGWVKIENGIVTDYSMIIGEYTVTYGVTTVKNGELKEKPEASSTTKVYENGTAIYYNPVSGKVCTDYVESNSTNENKTGCMKWYTFNDSSESSTVNVILDHNTTATLNWYSSNINVAYEGSLVKEEVDKLVSESGWVNTPRLITADEVTQITGNTSWTNTGSWFYLDSNSQTQTATSQGASKYAWLFDYTDGCTSNGCNIEDESTYGYWTSTPKGTASSGYFVWFVRYNGYLYNFPASDDLFGGGVRPVISISKSKLS